MWHAAIFACHKYLMSTKYNGKNTVLMPSKDLKESKQVEDTEGKNPEF